MLLLTHRSSNAGEAVNIRYEVAGIKQYRAGAAGGGEIPGGAGLDHIQ